MQEAIVFLSEFLYIKFVCWTLLFEYFYQLLMCIFLSCLYSSAVQMLNYFAWFWLPIINYTIIRKLEATQ